MFTGLIESVGVVRAVGESPYGVRLFVDPAGAAWGAEVTAGESIAVSGVCLTARDPERILEHGRAIRTDGGIAFDVIAETLAKTTLGLLRPGMRVNLERAVRGDTLMGGHFVQGHVDGKGFVRRIQDDPGDWRVWVGLDPTVMEAMVAKGSVAIDGVSLTLAGVHGDGIELALIPTTLERTTLGGLTVGDVVNVEADMLAKAVVATVRRLGLVGNPPGDGR